MYNRDFEFYLKNYVWILFVLNIIKNVIVNKIDQNVVIKCFLFVFKTITKIKSFNWTFFKFYIFFSNFMNYIIVILKNTLNL